MDAVLLSRIQFGFTIAFHILFPTLTIGLAWLLTFFEARYHRTQRREWLELYRFWVKIFALTFGMGVVSGLVLSYEIGTNWSGYSHIAGPVLGPLLSAEVLTAFFVEAGFLGVMLFGWDKVGPRLHFVATLLVAIGTTNSAFWILSANSWMQTPAGAAWHNGQLVPEHWLQVIFNPSFPYRLSHMLLASLLSSSLLVAGISAIFLLRRQHADFAARGLRTAVVALAILAPLQILVGDQSGLEVKAHQPAKLAAIEGIWHTQPATPLLLFAWPDQAAQTNHLELAVPHGGSLMLTHTWDEPVTGFDRLPRDQQPPVLPVFFGFRLMVGLGLWFMALGWVSLWLLRGDRLMRTPLVLKALALSTPLGLVATVAGWVVAEVGRQPWVVYGMLRTAKAVSPVAPGAVAGSLVVFVLVYGVLGASYVYFLGKVVRRGPAPPPKRYPEAMRGARVSEVVEES